MSNRAGYYDDMEDPWAHICWRGAVKSAIRGKRGQTFLKELVAALDAMPVKRLIKDDLEHNGDVCALGSVGRARGLDMSGLNPEDPSQLVAAFGIPDALVREIEYMNDEGCWTSNRKMTPEDRWQQMRDWAAKQIKPEQQP